MAVEATITKSFTRNDIEIEDMPNVALVSGANGITGSAIIEYLLTRTADLQWSQIIATSRSPPRFPFQDSRLVFIPLDFSQPVDQLVRVMQECCSGVTHAFFSSYVHRDEFADLVSENCALFQHFMKALIRVAPSLRNVTLQTGGKHYNLHLLPVPTPVQEDDPVQEAELQNFYHQQKELLVSMQKDSKWTWNEIRPQAIIGMAYGPNGMNSALCFAVYFTLCSYLHLEAPMLTNERNYNGTEDVSSAQLIADLTVYAATTPKCGNQAFNATNTDTFVWRHIWPRLAAHFGAKVNINQKFPQHAGNTVAVGSVAQSMSFVEWAKDKRQAWAELCEARRAPQAKSTFDSATWAYQDWVFRRSWTSSLSMNKAKKFGWLGWADSYDCFIETFLRFEKAGLIPPRNKTD